MSKTHPLLKKFQNTLKHDVIPSELKEYDWGISLLFVNYHRVKLDLFYDGRSIVCPEIFVNLKWVPIYSYNKLTPQDWLKWLYSN